MKKVFQRLAALSLAGWTALSLAAGAVPAYGADTEALQAAVSRAEQADVRGCTEGSAALLLKALDSAAQVMGDKNAGSSRVRNHVALLDAASQALVKGAQGDSLACGNYTIKGILRQASSDSPSMGNGSIVQPMEVVAKEGQITLRLQFTSLTVPGLGEGYLSELSYLPGWEGMLQNMTEEQYKAFQACTLEEYHEGVYDLFNHPDTGIDTSLRGKLYPKYLTMPVDYKDPEVWVKVYVPIMESISAGGGTQYARLQMDWDTLTWKEPDKRALEEAADQLARLKGTVVPADYTQEMAELLDQAIITGKDALDSTSLSQSQSDAMAQALNAVANLFADADKQYLYDMIRLAETYTGSEYTEAYTADMKERIQAARAVYNDTFATQTQVNEQYALLLQAVSNPQKKEVSAPATPAPGSTPTPSPEQKPPSSTEEPKKPSEEGNQKLDKDNLKDGIYGVTGKMVKIDKSTASMSNDAISHTIKLTVEKGVYNVSLNFTGLNISGMYGYLGGLKFFDQGYSLDSFGAPQGTVKAVTVDSYQLDGSGGRVSDTYGTDYPHEVTFPLIPEAVKDGYVPLQVYVPIMEAISQGTGTQPVFLFLDWDTLRTAREDDESFTEHENTGQPGATGTGTGTGTGLTAGVSRLGTSPSPIPGGVGAAKSSISGAKSTDSGKKGGTGLAPETPQTEKILSEGGLAEAGTEALGDVNPQDAQADEASEEAPGRPSPAAIPTVMSILMAAAGLAFKWKTRGGL